MSWVFATSLATRALSGCVATDCVEEESEDLFANDEPDGSISPNAAAPNARSAQIEARTLRASFPSNRGGRAADVAMSLDGNLGVVVLNGDYVKIYRRSESGWSESLLISPTQETTDFSKIRIALSGDGNTLAISKSDAGSDSKIEVHIYGFEEGAWTESSRLASPTLEMPNGQSSESPFFAFGSDIAFSDDGSVLALSDRGCLEQCRTTPMGSIYLDRKIHSTWAHSETIQGFLLRERALRFTTIEPVFGHPTICRLAS